jgi:hypothetical protein
MVEYFRVQNRYHLEMNRPGGKWTFRQSSSNQIINTAFPVFSRQGYVAPRIHRVVVETVVAKIAFITPFLKNLDSPPT